MNVKYNNENNMNNYRLDSRFRGNDRGEVNCHSGPRAGIQGNDNLMPKAFRIAESGRSMVEMLGTLAIIGVLSIGGIAGYKYGMDKYHANETLKDINLRVVDLLTQASQGHAALSLDEWDKEETLYDFANPAYVEGENLIAFDVGTTKKLPKSVCQMVFDGLANTAVQIDINAVHSNSNEDCGTDNTMTFYFEGGGTAEETPTGEQCGDTVCGTCQKCGCDVDTVGSLSLCDASPETCVSVTDYTECTVDGQSGWCVSGACEAKTTCDCNAGQYCADSNTSCKQPTPSDTCNDLDFRTVEIDGTTYYISNNKMNWWDAVSACEALGNKKLLGKNDLTVEDIVVRNDDDTTGYLSSPHEKTAVGKALHSEMGGKYVWSSILYDSCRAYGVYLPNGSVSYDNRHINFYAVCR